VGYNFLHLVLTKNLKGALKNFWLIAGFALLFGLARGTAGLALVLASCISRRTI
jgi:hypothetical protein